MKILLLGANGMLGQSIYKQFSKDTNIQIFTAARNDAMYKFDLLDDAALRECFDAVQPDVCINSAAIVNLSLCEENRLLAYNTNARLCSMLTELCGRYRTYYIQISTDHYYNGDGRKKHDEHATITLSNEYAKTKYVGEKFTELYDKSLILRTNIVGFRGIVSRPTFLEWAIENILNRKSMTLFNDFYTSSISTCLFADILRDVLKNQLLGIYNLASNTVSSKEEFIVNLSKSLFDCIPVYDVGSLEGLCGVKRANSLGLDVSGIELALGYAMPDLEKVLYSIKAEYKEGNGNGI